MPRSADHSGGLYREDTGEAEEEELAPEEPKEETKVLSVRVVFVALSLGTAVGLVALLMLGSRFCDDAVNTTDNANDLAFAACENQSSLMVNNSLIDSVSAKCELLTLRIADFLGLFDSEMDEIIDNYNRLTIDTTTLNTTFTSLLQLRPHIHVSVWTASDYGLKSITVAYGVLGVGVGFDGRYHMLRLDILNGTGPNGEIMFSTIMDNNGVPVGPTVGHVLYANGNPFAYAYTLGIHTTRDRMWSSVLNIGGTVASVQFIQWPSPNGEIIGFYLTLSIIKLSQILQYVMVTLKNASRTEDLPKTTTEGPS